MLADLCTARKSVVCVWGGDCPPPAPTSDATCLIKLKEMLKHMFWYCATL